RAGGIEKIDRRVLYEELRRQVGDSPQMGALFIVDNNGSMFINSIEFPSKPINVADRDYFRYYLTTPGVDLSISRPVMSRLVKRWRFNLMRPLNRPGEPFAGLLTVAFEAEYFKRFFSASSLGPHGRIALLRTDGYPLAFEPYVEKVYETDFRNTVLFREKLPASPSGTFHTGQNHNTIDTAARIVSYQRLSRFPVVAVVSLARDDVLALWGRKVVLHSGLTLGLCLAVALLMQLLIRHLDRLQATQNMLREQEEQVRIKAAQVDAANDAILLFEVDGRLVQSNDAFCKMTGYEPADLLGKRLHDVKPPEYAAGIDSNFQLLCEYGEATFESAYLAKDGTVLPVEINAQIMESEGRTLVLSIARDITERKRSEHREQTRLRILEEIATGAGLDQLLRYIVRYVEQEREGLLCSVLLQDEDGMHLRHGSAPSLPDFYNQSVDGLRIAEGMGSCGTAAYRRQRVVVEEIEGHPFWRGFKAAGEAGLRACWSEPVISAEGELLGTFATYHREPHSPDQFEVQLIESAVHLAGIAIDRFRSEEQRKYLEAQLHHVQRFEAIGQLAGGIAHDFNNLLTPIIVYADMIQRKLPDGDPLSAKAQGIMNAAYKARDLTRQLLSFGRKQLLTIKPADLNEIVTTFHDILRRTIRENIIIDVRLAPGGAVVLADRGQVEQILLNLAVNAQDAIEGTGTIVMETGIVVLDNEYARLHPGLQPGPYAMLDFSDDGCGMDDETLLHIFEPFFTTKQVGHGTGLGLATVY
ncbi:MAG TPA: PAS domain S-box protein, partial [Armatimonadota bacterium]